MIYSASQLEILAEVEDLYADYCQSLDDGEIKNWPNFFAKDGEYRVTTRENIQSETPLCLVWCEGQRMLQDRAAALERTVFHRQRAQRRILSGIRLKTFAGLDGPGLQAGASFVLYESVGDEPTALLASGRFIDTVVRVGDALKFKRRICVVDARVLPDSLVFPV